MTRLVGCTAMLDARRGAHHRGAQTREPERVSFHCGPHCVLMGRRLEGHRSFLPVTRKGLCLQQTSVLTLQESASSNAVMLSPNLRAEETNVIPRPLPRDLTCATGVAPSIFLSRL